MTCAPKMNPIVEDTTNFNRPTCSENEFKCKNGQCIDWDRVCDGETDCADETDEGGKCATSCNNSPCQQRCFLSPNGPVCKCSDGYQLNSDQKSCGDIDECSDGSTPCAQLCENMLGSFRCSCFSGFALTSDEVSCKSTDDQMFFVYSAFDTIHFMRPNFAKEISTNGSRIVGLDMHFDENLLYFTTEDSGALNIFNWTENSKTVNSMVINIGQPTKVAVDWITGNVYFIDKSQAIKVCHTRARGCITLLEHKHIKSLAIDAIHQRLFYSTVNKIEFTTIGSTIHMHSLDGSQM